MSLDHETADTSCRALSTLRRGESGKVRDLSEGSDMDRIREIGLGAGTRVSVISEGDPLVCEVGECRFGLCRQLARCILVDSDT